MFTSLNAWFELDSLQNAIFGGSDHHSLQAEAQVLPGPVAGAEASAQVDMAFVPPEDSELLSLVIATKEQGDVHDALFVVHAVALATSNPTVAKASLDVVRSVGGFVNFPTSPLVFLVRPRAVCRESCAPPE